MIFIVFIPAIGLPRSIADFNLEEVRLFEESLEQYELGFDVPFRKIKVSRRHSLTYVIK